MMKFNSKTLPLLSCFIVTAIFSVHFVVAKEVLQGHHPLALTTLRGLIGGVLITMVYFRSFEFSLIKKYWVKLFLIGFLGFFANQLLFMSGLKITSSLNASIITNAVPLVTAVLAIGFGLEIFSVKKILGILVGFSCVLYLMLQGGKSINVNWQGDLLIFSNMFVFAIAIIFIKQLTAAGLHYGVITAIMMLVGGGLSCMIAGADAIELLKWSVSSPRAFSMFLFEVFISTVVAYLLNFYALKHLVPSKITIFIYLQPFITAITGYYLYMSIPELHNWWAFIGILIGGVMVFRAKEGEIQPNK